MFGEASEDQASRDSTTKAKGRRPKKGQHVGSQAKSPAYRAPDSGVSVDLGPQKSKVDL